MAFRRCCYAIKQMSQKTVGVTRVTFPWLMPLEGLRKRSTENTKMGLPRRKKGWPE